jgi:K+-sensing histidine kinase KdpD
VHPESSPRLLRALKPVALVGACGFAAWLVAFIAQDRSWRGIVPFAFLLVVWLAGLLGGRTVGILGSVVAALVFATQLYRPLGSVAVHDDSARSNLAWMLLAGIVMSYLLLPAATDRPRRH